MKNKTNRNFIKTLIKFTKSGILEWDYGQKDSDYGVCLRKQYEVLVTRHSTDGTRIVFYRYFGNRNDSDYKVISTDQELLERLVDVIRNRDASRLRLSFLPAKLWKELLGVERDPVRERVGEVEKRE